MIGNQPFNNVSKAKEFEHSKINAIPLKLLPIQTVVLSLYTGMNFKQVIPQK